MPDWGSWGEGAWRCRSCRQPSPLSPRHGVPDDQRAERGSDPDDELGDGLKLNGLDVGVEEFVVVLVLQGA